VRAGLEIRGIIVIWLPSCRRLKGFAKKGATLAQNEVSQATSTDRLLGGHFAEGICPTGKQAHSSRVCKTCSEKN